MGSLSLSDRGHHTITLTVADGSERTFKIPTDLSVSEVERLLELQVKIESDLTALDASTEDVETRKARLFWAYIRAQLVVILRHYQPDIEDDFISVNIMQGDMLRILSFFNQNRYVYIPSGDDLKKKPSTLATNAV